MLIVVLHFTETMWQCGDHQVSRVQNVLKSTRGSVHDEYMLVDLDSSVFFLQFC